VVFDKTNQTNKINQQSSCPYSNQKYAITKTNLSRVVSRALTCCVAVEEQTVSIDVLDVSDFEADNNNISDEVAASPKPPSHPRPRSQDSQDTERESPRVALMGQRMHQVSNNFTLCVWLTSSSLP